MMVEEQEQVLNHLEELFVLGAFSTKITNEVKENRFSRGKVCPHCGNEEVSRIGNIILELICKGRMKHTDLERLFRDRIEEESILCTDSHKSYIKFAKKFDVELQQVKRGKHKEGIYHIQHINAFHGKLKKWMDRFNGVATKYLANYMYWFKWLQFFNTEKETIKSKSLLVQSHTSHIDTKLKDFRFREAIYT